VDPFEFHLGAEPEADRLADLAARSSAGGVVITDATLLENPIIYASPTFEHMTGYPAREILGRNCRFLQGDDRDQPALGELRAALTEGRECRVVLRNYKKDGTLFWNELSISPVHDEEGHLTNFIGVQNDVTDRKTIEEKLGKSEDRLRLAVEATGLGTWDFDLLTGELRWDERCKAMFGLPPYAEVDYGTFLAGLHPEDRGWMDGVVRRALDPGSGGGCDVEHRTVGLHDGVERWVAARGQVFFEAGRSVRFIGTVLDITDRKKAEEERDLLFLRERAAREEAEAARGRIGLLAESGAILSTSLDYGATLARVARLTIPEFADCCLVDVLGEDGCLRQLAVAHANPEREPLLRELGRYREIDAEELKEANRVVSTVLRTGTAILLPEAEEVMAEGNWEEEHLAMLRELEPRSCICAPLVARGRALGAISFVLSRPGRQYGPDDLSLAESLAQRCAFAVDNSRLYRARTRTARALQENLLPARLPEMPGVEVGLSYLPAGEADVGGDFYDLFETGTGAAGGRSWGAVIGDVSGKGAEAAAVLALARYTLRAAAMHRSRPSIILADLNETMLRHAHEQGDQKFCTVAYARLEPDAAGGGAGISVSLGGHPAPMLLYVNGEVRRAGYPGRAVGVFDEPRLTDQESRLNPGDALVLFTDGVTEARSPGGGFFGEERLAALLRSSTGLAAPSLAARIESAVLDFHEDGERDDIAILVLRIPAQPDG